MPKLALHVHPESQTCLEVQMEPIELRLDDPDYGWSDGVRATVSFSPDTSGQVFTTTFDTTEWQLGRLYFETLANSFARIAAFAPMQFPISYYCSPTEARPAPCTLRVDLDSIHVFLTGITGRNGRVNSSV